MEQPNTVATHKIEVLYVTGGCHGSALRSAARKVFCNDDASHNRLEGVRRKTWTFGCSNQHPSTVEAVVQITHKPYSWNPDQKPVEYQTARAYAKLKAQELGFGRIFVINQQ